MMTEARETESTQEEILEMLNRSHEDPGNDGMSLIDGAKPLEFICSKPDKPESCDASVNPTLVGRARKSKRKRVVSVLSKPERADAKMLIIKSNEQKTDSSHLKPMRNVDLTKLEHRNQKTAARKPNSLKMPLLCTPGIPRRDAESSQMNTEPKRCKSARVSLPSVVSKPEHRNQKTEDPKSNARKKPLLCKPNMPNRDTDLGNMNPGANELKPARAQSSPRLLCKSNMPNRETDLGNMNPGANELKPARAQSSPRLLCNPDKQSSYADVLKLNSGAKERKSTWPKRNPVWSKDEQKVAVINTNSSQLKPKQGPSVSTSSHFTNQNSAVLKINSGQMDSPCEFENPKSRTDLYKRNTCSEQVKPKHDNCPSVSSSSEHANQKIEDSNSIPKKIPALMDLDIPRPHPDFFKMNTVKTKQFKTKRRNFPQASSKPKQRKNQKIAANKSNPREKTVSCNPDKSSSRPFKLYPQVKEVKPIQGNLQSVSSNSKSGNSKQKISANEPVMDPTINLDKRASYADVLKRNKKVMELKPKCENIPVSSADIQNCEIQSIKSQRTESEHCPDKPLSNADQMKLNIDHWKLQSGCEIVTEGSVERNGWEQKCAVSGVNGQEMNGETCNAVCQLKQNPTNVERALTYADINQNIASCSATVQSEHLALSVQERQAAPASYATIVVVNNSKQPDAMSSAFTDVNDNLGIWNTEVMSAAFSLQQSQAPHEHAPRQNRLARFLTLSIKPWFQIVDTNTQNDSNDNSAQHGGHLPQNSNEGRLPDTFLELKPDGGPVTPELYKSSEESFGWNWPLAAIPEWWTIGGTGQDHPWTPSVRRVAQLDHLPQLEMSGSQSLERVEETVKEPDFGLAEDCGNEHRASTAEFPWNGKHWIRQNIPDFRLSRR